jgi:DNA-binding XRE family transcriptional regulator
MYEFGDRRATQFRMKKYRRRAGLSQEQLAILLGISRTHVVNLEDALAAPSWDTAADVATALGCTLDELAGLTEPE